MLHCDNILDQSSTLAKYVYFQKFLLMLITKYTKPFCIMCDVLILECTFHALRIEIEISQQRKKNIKTCKSTYSIVLRKSSFNSDIFDS